MDLATRERALEPFFSTKPGHLGIGLSIANAIWRRHHGTFAIQSQPGAGAQIRLAVDPAGVKSHGGAEQSAGPGWGRPAAE